MVRWYLVQEAVIISFPSQHHKLDTNCAVRMTRLWRSMSSKLQLQLILATLHLLHVQLVGWVSLVSKVDEEQVDVDIQFMHLHGPLKTFNWPQGGDSCYVPIKKIVCAIQAPITTT